MFNRGGSFFAENPMSSCLEIPMEDFVFRQDLGKVLLETFMFCIPVVDLWDFASINLIILYTSATEISFGCRRCYSVSSKESLITTAMATHYQRKTRSLESVSSVKIHSDRHLFNCNHCFLLLGLSTEHNICANFQKTT